MIKEIAFNNHEEWLEIRKKYIGGSDAAAVVGLNSFSSPYTVWADKLGKLPPKEDNEAMRLGRDLEDYVGKRFTEQTGKKVRRKNFILWNSDYPFAHANVDRLIVGENAGLECKTTSVLNLKNFKNGEFPENYYVQCMHYMAVTGYKKWYLAVLILGKEFKVFEIERDEDEIKALMKAESEFWTCVEKGEPPMIDGSEATTNTIKTVLAESNDDTPVNLFAYDSTLEQYIALSKQIKELENLRDEMANKVKVFMDSSAKGESDKYKVSFASSLRQSFDSKRFAKDNPNIDLSDYYKTSTYRTFKVNEK
jgi:putative phage-type endonuclease